MKKKDLVKYTILLSLGISLLQIGISLIQKKQYLIGALIELCGIFLIAFYIILREG